MADPIRLDELVSASLDAAEAAGKVIMEVFVSEDLCVRDKGTSETMDPQTVADLRAQKLITESMALLFPHLPMIGEEGDVSDSVVQPHVSLSKDRKDVLDARIPSRALEEKRLVVWIDPLDGTASFVAGHMEGVTVLIGIAYDGIPLAGVIHHPKSQRTLWGVVGIGTFGAPIKTSKPPSSYEEAVVVSYTPTAASREELKEAIGVYPATHIPDGGSGYRAIQLLQGDADVFIYIGPYSSRWDTCAPEAILRSIGGTLTDQYGGQMDYTWSDKSTHYNERGLLASRLPLSEHLRFARKRIF